MWYLPCTTTHHRALAKLETIHRQKQRKKKIKLLRDNLCSIRRSVFACQWPVTFTVTFTAFGVTNIEHAREKVRLKQDLVVLSVSLFTVTGDPGVPGCQIFIRAHKN